ncbi:hypothetical protein ACFFP0_05015 [Rhizobium puerariae]|uniref:Transposase n=1 Tax=Rhizobium puerariae TaxID=1585791 RepID=A0ABV6AC39_9HYPH
MAERKTIDAGTRSAQAQDRKGKAGPCVAAIEARCCNSGSITDHRMIAVATLCDDDHSCDGVSGQGTDAVQAP